MIFVHTLGTALIDLGGARITPASARKFALLLHLSAELGRRVSRGVLRDLIFPDQTEKNARHSLRELVYQLRQRGVDLDADPDGVVLRAESVRFDYTEIMDNGLPDAQRLKAIEGGFLPGYAPSHSEAYTEWLEGYRARATFELCKTLLKAVSRARVGSDWLMTEQAARACLALDPLNEEATIALAEILAVGGAKAQAIGLLDRYMHEVGPHSRGLTLPAAVLRRRIGERLQESYPTTTDFPLVGRQPDMALLNERLATAKTGESQCVVLHGEPGIGKSRLAAECCSWAALAGWRIERVAVQPHDRERPMAAFVELVPNILKLPGSLGAAPESLTALNRLTKHELRDAPIEVESPESSDAVSAAIVRAINDVIDAVASEAPLILLVEDVQWLDAESLRTLAGLVSPRRSRRLLILLTSRESDPVRYFARHAERLASIGLAQLPPECCTTLVHQSIGLGASKADHSFRDWLVSASGGNPFFLHSLVRHYQTTGQEFVVSPTVNALLDHRLATLSAGAMTVLSTAVALGNHSTIDRLVAVLEMHHVDLITTIRELEVSRLIAQSGHLVAPAHWLISDAVTRRATTIADRVGHRRIAAILEAEARANDDADKLWDCAQHWLAADDIPRAIDMLTQCAQHSIEIGRLREAAELLVKAASLTGNPVRHDLACRAIRLAEQASELDVVLRAAELVDRTCRAGAHDDIEFAELYARGVASFSGEETRSQLEACVLSPHADRSHRIKAGRALLAIADIQRADLRDSQALQSLNRLLESSNEADDPVALKFLLLYHASIGDIAACPGLSRRLVRVAQDVRPEIAADLHRYAGGGFWRSGEIDEAVATLEGAFALANSVGLHRLKFSVASVISSLQCDLGNTAESKSWMDRADQIADEIPALRASFAYTAICVELAITRSDADELKRLLKVMPQDARLRNDGHTNRVLRLAEISILRLSGDVLDAKGATEELVRHHVPRGETGNISDLETAIAATLVDETGDPDAARRLVANYLHNYRRGFAPIGAMLASLMRRLNIQGLPPWCQPNETSR